MNPEADHSSVRSSGRESKLHAWSEMHVGFKHGPVDYLWLYYTTFYSARPEGRINDFYVDTLTVWKEPTALNHEYLVATIKSRHSKNKQEESERHEQQDDQNIIQEDIPTAGENEEYYLLFERTAGKLNRERRREEYLPEKWADIIEELENEEDSQQNSPDRHLEEKTFNAASRRKPHGTVTPQGSVRTGSSVGGRDVSGLITAVLDLASSASESSSADLLLAEDWFQVIESPRRHETDQIVALLQLGAPPLESPQGEKQRGDTLLSERTMVDAVAGTRSMAESIGSLGVSLPSPTFPRISSNQHGTFRTSRQDLTSLRQQPSSEDVTPRHPSSTTYKQEPVADSRISSVTSLPYPSTSNISPQLNSPPDTPSDTPPPHDETLPRPSGSGRSTPVSPASPATAESRGNDQDPVDDFHADEEGSDEIKVVIEGDNDEQVDQDADLPSPDEQDEQATDRPLSPGSVLSEIHSSHSSHSIASDPSLHHFPLSRFPTNATHSSRSSGRSLASFAHSFFLRRMSSNATRYYDSLPVPPSRPHIYFYELVVLACRLHKCKSLYRIFTRNCYWFAGMIFHVVRKFTGETAHVADEEGSEETLGPSQEVHRWINEGRMGTFLRSITVVKAPRMFTVDALIRKWHGAIVRFRDQIEVNRRDGRSDSDAFIEEIVEAEQRKRDAADKTRQEERQRQEETARVEAEKRLQEVREEERREAERRLLEAREERKEAERRLEEELREAERQREEERRDVERQREEERREAERQREEERRRYEEERRRYEEEMQQRLEAEVQKRLNQYRRAARSTSRTPSRTERPEHGSDASEGEE